MTNKQKIIEMLRKALIFEETALTNKLRTLLKKVKDKQSKEILHILQYDTLEHITILSYLINRLKNE